MNTQTMTQQIAEYFKTQPVLKAWLPSPETVLNAIKS